MFKLVLNGHSRFRKQATGRELCQLDVLKVNNLTANIHKQLQIVECVSVYLAPITKENMDAWILTRYNVVCTRSETQWSRLSHLNISFSFYVNFCLRKDL